MKTLPIILTLLANLTIWTDINAQDGSDIMYGKVGQIDKSFIGDYIHLDFYNRSFHGKKIDTVTIDIDNKPIKFLEHRKDNGYNNWFNDQYLETVEKVDGLTIRIIKSRLDSITSQTFFVTNYLEFFDINNKQIPNKSRQITNIIQKDIITEVLVSADYHNRQK